jgi:hypothetical protein
MTALYKEACGGASGNVNHNVVRAVMRTAPWSRNPSHYRYSTPVDPTAAATDWRDGGGALSGDNVLSFCGKGPEGGPAVGAASYPGTLSGGVRAAIKPACSSCGGSGPPPGGQAAGGLKLQELAKPGTDDGRLYQLVWTSGTARLPAGTEASQYDSLGLVPLQPNGRGAVGRGDGH